ncbi:MAG: TetR/AcrR family transcriptional regulator [Myxococcota bacterium]
MARTRSSTYDDKRQRIRREAARLFAQHGYAGTSIDQISQACEASKSWLYHYYRSKDALLYDVLRDHMQALNRVLAGALAEGGEPETQFRRALSRLVDNYVDYRDELQVLMKEIDQLAPEQRDEVRALERDLVHSMRSLLRRLQPQLDDTRARASTMALFGMINWVYTWFRVDRGIDAETFGALAADLFLEGLLNLRKEPQ